MVNCSTRRLGVSRAATERTGRGAGPRFAPLGACCVLRSPGWRRRASAPLPASSMLARPAAHHLGGASGRPQLGLARPLPPARARAAGVRRALPAVADLPIQLPAMPFLTSEEAWALALTTFAGLSTCIGAGFAVRSAPAMWVLAAAVQQRQDSGGACR